MKMFRTFTALIAVIAISAFLPGCADFAGGVKQQIATVEEKAFTPDFTAALADAQAANHQSGITCWSFWSNWVATLPQPSTTTTPAAQFAGVASGLELLSEQAGAQLPNIKALLNVPQLPANVHDACAGVLLNDATIAGKLGIGLGVLKDPAAVATLKATALGKP